MEIKKVFKWEDLTLAQKDNISVLLDQKKIYEEQVANVNEDKSYKKICDGIYKLEKIQQKESEKLALKAQKEKATAEAKLAKEKATAEAKLAKEKATAEAKLAKEKEKKMKIAQFKKDSMSVLDVGEWYYIEKDEKFARYVNETGWSFIGEKGFRHGYGLYKHSVEGNTVDPLEDVTEALRHGNRIKESVQVIWNGQVPSNILNCATVDGWLKPEDGDVDIIFDLLLKSVFGGNQEVVDNFEHTIAYAYLHPEVGGLPCFVLFGQGGAGKNELCELVMPTLFTKHMCFSGTPDLYFESFTGHLLGKKFLMVDEAGANDIKPEKLRNKVGAKSLTIHPKGMTPFLADNVAIWVIATNEQTGMKMLRGDNSDRRYTVQMLTKNIMEWVSEYTGLEYSNKSGENVGSGPAVNWWFENNWKLSSPEYVSKWLYRIVKKYANSKKPHAVHGESYKMMLEDSMTPLSRMIKDVFDEYFVYITDDEMFELYKKYVEDESVDKNSKFASSKTSMTRQVKSWLKIHRPKYAIDKRIKLGGKMGTNINLYHINSDATASSIPKEGRCSWILRDYMGVTGIDTDKKIQEFEQYINGGVVVDFDEVRLSKQDSKEKLRMLANSL